MATIIDKNDNEVSIDKTENKDISELNKLFNGVQKNLISRAKNIHDRVENIKTVECKSKPEEKKRWWDGLFSKTKGITKGSAALATKSIINVELLASQEEAAGELKLEGLGLLDKIRAGKKIDKEIDEKTGKELLELMNKIKDELTERIDSAEERLNSIDQTKLEKPDEQLRLPDKLTNIGEAYKAIESVYQGLSERLDIMEENLLSKIEQDLKQDIKMGKGINKPLIPEGEEPKVFKEKNKDKYSMDKTDKTKAKSVGKKHRKNELSL